MYKIKPQFENQIINLKKNTIDIKFDTSIAYTQYQLHNMYQLDMYAPYIEHVNELLPNPVEITETKLQLEHIKLPKQDKPVKEKETKPKQKRTKKAKQEVAPIVDETKCELCEHNPCSCEKTEE